MELETRRSSEGESNYLDSETGLAPVSPLGVVSVGYPVS